MKNFLIFVSISLFFLESESLTRQDLLDHLKYAQETRNTFDSRIRQGDYMKPIGYIAGKPIWPRVLDRVRSTGELFFDDDNIAYVVHDRNPAGMIRKMDKEKNFDTVMKFLERYT
uniref:Serine hydrolase n=1 Tax=Caenorhabditis tropicalis TaxID=1561998 RepID=A0A1I7T5C6_9PELO